MPWKTLHPETSLPTAEFADGHGHGDLIVVASLIDKIPNLGGICRTCEIFGVAEYVIGSLKFIESREFQTLSVTAEKWLKISEVIKIFQM